MTPTPDAPDLDWLVTDLRARGVERVHSLAWRDLDDPDAGGSEVHIDECERRWAAAGLTIAHRTSAAVGRPPTERRNGYDVVRRGGRYTVFPRAVVAELTGRMGPKDALVEIWNGVPWWSPVWCRRPHLVVVHHVHGPMWDQIFPPPFAALGRAVETRLAPLCYRRALVVTPSDATRDELLQLGYAPERVIAVPNGVDRRFSPGGHKTEHPSIVAVGRLAPVKRFDVVLDAAATARNRVPGLRLTIVGEGPLRAELEARIESLEAGDWVELAGRVTDDELIAAYRRAWLVVSGSLAEGWGLSLTEGAGCGTPAVATDITGHRSSVVDGMTGVLTDEAHLGDAIADVLLDGARRAELGANARRRAEQLTWDSTATGVLAALHRQVVARDARRTGR